MIIPCFSNQLHVILLFSLSIVQPFWQPYNYLNVLCSSLFLKNCMCTHLSILNLQIWVLQQSLSGHNMRPKIYLVCSHGFFLYSFVYDDFPSLFLSSISQELYLFCLLLHSYQLAWWMGKNAIQYSFNKSVQVIPAYCGLNYILLNLYVEVQNDSA